MKKILLSAFVFASAFTALHADDLYRVIRVSDGDTLTVSFNGKNEPVRLIGIDCPESRKNAKAFRDSDRDSRDIDAIVSRGKEAARFVRSLVKKGSMVKLEFDAQQRDKYGRLLAYVYLSDGRMLNEVIVESGYAAVMTVPPNVKYIGRLKKAQDYARKSKTGLWKE